MNGLSKDELGFVRAHGYGRTSHAELDKLLNVESDEEVYVSTLEKGVRTSKPMKKDKVIKTKSGDTFSVGPRVTKAAFWRDVFQQQVPVNSQKKKNPEGNTTLKIQYRLEQEISALKRAGFGWIEPAQQTEWGWVVYLKGMLLPGGVRTDALVLLPDNYPLVSPIGFYVKNGAATAHLDTSHLFDENAYHGAVNLSEQGWHWFCGIAEGWKPGKHTLVSYITIVSMLFNDQQGK